MGNHLNVERVSKDLANRKNQNDLDFKRLQLLITCTHLPPGIVFAAIR